MQAIYLRCFFCFFCGSIFLGLNMAAAQVPNNPLGVNPFGLRWQQINNERVQVIFPKGLEASGQRVANLVHWLWDSTGNSVGNRKEKVTILLQNQTTVPNGFVTVGPFRSEFFLTPPQFGLNGATNWLDILAIHEYRHVQQFANSHQGITKLARRVLGSWAWGGLAGTALPRWYWEGDAVGTETSLTQGGRGRLPEFDMEYKSLITNNIHYGYEKAAAGSLRDFVPSHYELGYYLTTQARQRFGAGIWADVAGDAVRYKGLFFPFSRALKRHTGWRTPQLYRATRATLDTMWKAEAQRLTYREGRRINQKVKPTYTDYRNPHYLANNEWIVEKSSFAQIPTFYQLFENGKEKRLRAPGIYPSRNRTLSVVGNQLCWAEQGTDPRWGYQNFSNIKMYNFQTKRIEKITHRGRYFAPALSPDARQIAAVEISPEMQYQIVVFQTGTKQKIVEIPTPDNAFPTYPRWTDDGKALVMVLLSGEQNWLARLELDSRIFTPLTTPSSHQITFPCVKGEWVYFAGAHTGINNIFALKMGQPDIYQVTSAKLGAFQPTVSPDGLRLAYSDFTPMGYDLREVEITPEAWPLWSDTLPSPSEITFYQPLVAQEKGKSILNELPQQAFPVRKFNKWQGLLNPHSILPTLFPPVFGARILSDNKFSTLSAELGAFYNANEREMSYSASLSYAELYPILNVGFERAERARSFSNFQPTNDTTIVLTLYNEEWRENDFFVGLALPINFSQGTFVSRMNLQANYHWLNLESRNQFNDPENFRLNISPVPVGRFRDLYEVPLQSDILQAIDLRKRTFILQTTARQNLLPRWGLLLDVRYRRTLGSNQLQGEVFNGSLDVYMPGFFRNHHFYVSTAFQAEDFNDNYKFRNLFFYPRGYQSTPISDRINKISFNYSLPLFYPDWAVAGPLAFLKRIKANFFFDYARTRAELAPGLLNTIEDNLQSLGVELTFDVRLLRLLEVDLGLRYSFLPQPFSGQGQHVFDFLLFSIGI